MKSHCNKQDEEEFTRPKPYLFCIAQARQKRKILCEVITNKKGGIKKILC